MPTRIRERICRLCAEHPRVFAILEGWVLLALVLGGSFAVGLFAGQTQADDVVIDQARAHQAEQQRLMDINRQLLLIIEQRLPAIAETAGTAAETAKAAADTARQAAARAGTAGRTAQVAASQAGEAARKVDEAVTPAPRPPAEAPEWLQ